MSDRQAFRAIYETHHAAICAYFARRAPRDEVEDLAAETFVVAWRKLPRRVEHPLPWLYAVAGNVLANHRRKTKRKGAFPPDPATGDPAERVSDRGLAIAFATLSDRERGHLPRRLGGPDPRGRRARRRLQRQHLHRALLASAQEARPRARPSPYALPEAI